MDVVVGNFEWDIEKNKSNINKHGISFEEILPLFDDPLFWEKYDKVHSTPEENRFLGMGKINGIAVVVTSYTERNNRTRIISARISTREEEKLYEQWCRKFYN